jgi:hypothetical protein
VTKHATSGSLELKISGWDYASFVVVGLFAMFPVTTWLMMVMLPLGLDEKPHGGEPTNPILVGIFVALAMFAMLVMPWLVPILVLRARQPRGARIAWDQHGVTEWDGTWKRSFIAWTELRAGHLTWETKTKSGTHVDEALQLVGPPPAAAITVWSEAPAGVPNFRRRLCAGRDRVVELREAVERHGIELTRAPDWLLACDSDRPPHRALTIAGRFGYPLATAVPIAVPISHPVGIAMAVAAAALLTLRALPSVREVRAIVARGRERAAMRDSVTTSDEASPYRDAGAAPSAEHADADDDARARTAADRSKLSAATVEAVVRVGCVVMVVVSTVVAFFMLH